MLLVLLDMLFSLVFLLGLCYIIAEGFWFMPLSLVSLRTFRLST